MSHYQSNLVIKYYWIKKEFLNVVMVFMYRNSAGVSPGYCNLSRPEEYEQDNAGAVGGVRMWHITVN